MCELGPSKAVNFPGVSENQSRLEICSTVSPRPLDLTSESQADFNTLGTSELDDAVDRLE